MRSTVRLPAPPDFQSGTQFAAEIKEQIGGQVWVVLDGIELSVTADGGDDLAQDVVEQMLADHVPQEPAPASPSDAEVIANLKTRLASAEATLDQIIIDALMGDFPPP